MDNFDRLTPGTDQVPVHGRRTIERLERQLSRHPEQAQQLREQAAAERERHKQLYGHFAANGHQELAGHHQTMHELAALLVANCELAMGRPDIDSLDTQAEQPSPDDPGDRTITP